MSLTKQDLAEIRTVVVDGINEAFEALINPRFDRLEERMDNLEGRMSGLETHMRSLEGRMSRLETEQRELASGQQETNNRLSRLEQSMDSISGRLQALEDDVKDLYKLVKKREHPTIGTKKYLELPDDKKLLVLHNALHIIAKHLNIQLPTV